MTKKLDLMKSEIFFESKDYFVFYKASGLPSAPLKKIEQKSLDLDEKNFYGEKSALRELAKTHLSVLEIQSKFKAIEGGLVHRIDTATSGLILCAKNQKTYDYFIDTQNKNLFSKTYTAFCKKQKNISQMEKKHYPKLPLMYSNQINIKNFPLCIESSFRNFGPKGAAVRPVLLDNEKKFYQTELLDIKNLGFAEKIQVRVNRAYRHQVRSHLSWLGYPILGDVLYGIDFPSIANNKKPENIGKTEKNLIKPMLFFASSLSFIDPETKKQSNYALEEDLLLDFSKKLLSSETR